MADDVFTTLDDSGSPSFNELLGIDDAGEVVGYFANNGVPTAYALAPPYAPFGTAVYQNLSPSVSGGLAPGSVATAIDNAATVVGIQVSGSTTVGAYGMTSTGGASTVAGTVQLLGINDALFAVGYSVGSNGANVAVEASRGAAARALAIPGVAAAVATGIDDAGVIVGYDTVGGVVEGFVFDPVANTVLQLKGPSGATQTEALGLNNQGQVVGEYRDAAGIHGFVYTLGVGTVAGSYVTIDEPNANAETVVNGINDLGQIVGYYVADDGSTHGFLGTSTIAAVPTVSNPLGGSTLAIGEGMQGLAVQGSSAVVLSDSGIGHVTLFGNAGNDTVVATGAADTIVAGTGNTRVFAGTAAAGTTIYLSSGANTVGALAAVTVSGGNGLGSTVNANGGGLVFAGSGQAVSVIGGVSDAATTVVGGSGTLAVNLAAGGGLVFAGAGASTLQGGAGPSTIVGGSGVTTDFAGLGGGLIWGGTGSGTYVGNNATTPAAPTLIVAGFGQSAVYAYANDTVFLVGSSNDLVVDGQTASTGNETLVATASSGANTFRLGTGSDLVFAGAGRTEILFAGGSAGSSTVAGGSGTDIYQFDKGTGGGGTYFVDGFRPGTDLISLGGSFGDTEAKTDLANASFARGSTKLTLSDKTTVTFVGVHLTLGSFV